MSSVIDVCNLALARLGDRATVASIDPPEGSSQADHCARFYPLARDIALEARPWSFNTVRSNDNPLYVDPQPGWGFAYAKPNDCLKVLSIVPTYAAAEWWMADAAAYTIETDLVSGTELILTNMPFATIVYQRRIDDTDFFPPQFVSALAWLLASYLAGPVVKGDAGRKTGKAAYQAYTLELSQAATINANQSQRRQQYVPESMRARGGYPMFVTDAPIVGQYGWYAYPSAVGPRNG